MEKLSLCNVKEACRLCLKIEGRKIGIFEEEGLNRQIGYKIRKCLSDLIYPGDPLPQSICPRCLFKLENAFEFQQKFLKNFRILRNILQEGTRGAEVPSANEPVLHLENHESLPQASSQASPIIPAVVTNTPAPLQDSARCVGEEPKEQQQFQCKPIAEKVDVDPHEEICRIFLQDGSNDEFLPESDDAMLSHAVETREETPVKPRNEDESIQEIPTAAESIESIPSQANLKQIAEHHTNTAEEIRAVIKKEPEEAEEEEIEAEMVVQPPGQEQDTLDISGIKAEPMMISLKTIKQEQPEAEEASPVRNNSPDIKQETSNGIAHQQSKSKTSERKCCNCLRVFDSEYQLLYHRCIGVSQWYCNPCNKYYKSRETLARHKRYVCRPKQLTCFVCSRSFPDKIQLAQHQIIHLKLEVEQLNVTKLNNCKICNITFISKASLNLHERIHYLKSTKSNGDDTETNTESPQPSTSNMLKLENFNTFGKAKKTYSCTECKSIFINQKSLMVHKQQHGLKEIYKCLKCPVTLNNARDKKEHERIWHNADKNGNDAKSSSNSRYACIICRKSFASSAILVEHKKQHTPARKARDTRPFSAFATCNDTIPISDWVCKICGLDCKLPTILWEHMHKKHSRVSHKCTHCSRRFDKLSSLKKHEKIHETKFSCRACEKQYSTLNALAAHEQSKHVFFNTPHLCRKCNVRFETRSALLIHARSHQNMPKLKEQFTAVSFKSPPSPFTCTICSKTFSRSDSLKRHVKVHAKGKPVSYPSKICGLKFESSASNKAHSAMHFQESAKTTCSTSKQYLPTMEFTKYVCDEQTSAQSTSHQISAKKFKCELCTAVYATQQARNSHMRIHRKNYKYTCKSSKPTHSITKSLKHHGKVSRPVYCPVCSTLFVSKEVVLNHIKYDHQM